MTHRCRCVRHVDLRRLEPVENGLDVFPDDDALARVAPGAREVQVVRAPGRCHKERMGEEEDGEEDGESAAERPGNNVTEQAKLQGTLTRQAVHGRIHTPLPGVRKRVAVWGQRLCGFLR